MKFKRSQVFDKPVQIKNIEYSSLKEYADLINIELPRYNAFDFLGAELDPNAELTLLEPLLTSSHPEQDYLNKHLQVANGTLMMYFGDVEPPDLPGAMILCNQLEVRHNLGTYAGFPYPVIDPTKIEIIERVRQMPIKVSRSVSFYGWYREGMHHPERAAAVQALSDFPNAELELNTRYRGTLSFEEWIHRCIGSQVCLIPPGIGLNSWRLSELLALGVFCIAIQPISQLEFEERLQDRLHLVYSTVKDLPETCRYWLRHDSERQKIAQSGREWAQRWVIGETWRSRIQDQARRLVSQYQANRGICLL